MTNKTEDFKKNRKLTSFWQDESGQSTVEYILVLAISVMITAGVMRKLLKPMYEKLMASVSKNLEEKLVKADLHTYRVRR